MALDRLLASCPEAQKLLEYFKIKARIEKKIDTMVANVRNHTNKKLAGETLTQLVRQEPEKIGSIEAKD